MGILIFGLVYYFGLTKLYAKYAKGGRKFHVDRIAKFDHDQEDIQIEEEVHVEWLPKMGSKEKIILDSEGSEVRGNGNQSEIGEIVEI